MEDLVSIIVPVYNVEAFLPRCLDSIAGQTYGHFEVILVDDGSTDSSGRICDEYCARDNRFKVIHQENKWLAKARNAGLKAATGDFLYFVDSDDAIHPLLLERMLRVYHGGGCDLVVCGYREEYEAPERYYIDELPSEPQVSFIDSDTMLRNMILEYDEQNCVAWNKLIPRHLAEGLEFADIYGSEDAPFTMGVVLRSKIVAFIDEPLYQYTMRSSSIIHSSWNKWLTYHPIMRYTTLKLIPPEKTDLRSIAFKKLYRRLLSTKGSLRRTEYEAEFAKISKDILKDTFRGYLKDRGVPVTDKLAFLLLWPNPWALSMIVGHWK